MDEVVWGAEKYDSIINISTIEHAGLGRYGDPLGCQRGCKGKRFQLAVR